MTSVLKNSVFIICGIVLMYIAEFILQGTDQTEIIKLILGFVGFASILNGAFGLYGLYRPHKNEEWSYNGWTI